METKKSESIKTLLLVAGLIATLTVATFASISSNPTAFAAPQKSKDTRCAKGTQGTGDPHDAENPTNPHDFQRGVEIGNPHDEC
jgi:hypothetical protein